MQFNVGDKVQIEKGADVPTAFWYCAGTVVRVKDNKSKTAQRVAVALDGGGRLVVLSDRIYLLKAAE